jgi:predicted NBD/HSP70 family sugar kinase
MEGFATAHSSSGPSIVRDLNTASVVDVLRRHGPMTQAALIRHSGLARPTVGAIVKDLFRQHVVVDAGPDRSANNGRPGSLLAFNPRCATIAVIRLLRDLADVWIGDSDGCILAHSRTPNPTALPRRLDHLAAETTRLATEIAVPRPSSIGMLLAGRVDPTTGLCVGAALAKEPVALIDLERGLGAAVVVVNPTAAAALGVARAGQYADALVIFLDQGIGAGLVCGGQVLIGANGGAGELGHCRLPGASRTCQCGSTGCLETVGAGWFLRQRANEILGSRRGMAPTLAALERLGNAEIDLMLSDAARQLGLGASWLINTLNPQTVLLGGTPFAAGADRFLATFAESVRQHSMVAHTRDLIIDFAQPTADIDGAAQAALDRVVILAP